MTNLFMLLPAKDFDKIRLLQVPEDFAPRDALRHVTDLIAGVQTEKEHCSWDDVLPVLEDHGFTAIEFMVGPELDCMSGH